MKSVEAVKLDARPSDQELDVSQERLSALIRATSDVVYTMSPDWREMRELIGRDFIADTSEPSVDWLEKYILPEEQEGVLAAIKRATDSRTIFQYEHRVVRVDGTVGWVLSRAIPILNDENKIIQWFGAATDITARKQVEQALLNSQRETERQRRLYEAILGNTPDLAYIFDPQHRFIYANEGLLKMWGKSGAEAFGKTCLELGYEPWHAAMHDREIDHVVATGQPLRGEVPFTGTFGRRIYDYIFVPVFGPDGSVEAVAGTTRDVTELREADRRKDEFLATLAHELRNPLAPLKTSLEIMRMQGASEAESVREIMQRQVNHLCRLVDDLLEISRITTGTFELRREPVELKTVVQNAIETSDPLIKAARHTLNVSMPGEELWVYGDPVRLSQIVANLLNNAARYTPHGGVVTVSVRREGAVALICVKDNGIGIAGEDLWRIFEMFGRATPSNGQSDSGLGIGLTLARRLAEMHGGTVEVRSEGANRGAEFIVRLPIEPGGAPLVPAHAANEAIAATMRILVVDDNRDAAVTLAILLKMLDAEVQTVHDGPAALEAYAAIDPDVVLLDIGLPGMGGYAIARALRERYPDKHATLVALTGWGQEEDRRRSREAGFSYHLVKPVDIDEIKQILTNILRP